MAEKNMNAKISVEFEETANRQQLSSGDNLPTLFGKIKKIISDLANVAFSGSYKDLSDTPTTATKDTDGLMSAEDKSKLDNADNTYALKSKYGDTTINVGRKAGTIVGHFSTAEGQATTASSLCSHAEGDQTTASGNFSHSEGEKTKAIGAYSHAEGCGTEANGIASHAEGRETTAFGDYSHTSGYYTKALHDNEAAYGKYNVSNDGTLFSIGDGTADDARHNAFEITTNGGKLHDKDIATTDLIPTSLPANGGNADTAKTLSEWGKAPTLNLDNVDFGFIAASDEANSAPNTFWSTVLTVGQSIQSYAAQLAFPWSYEPSQAMKYRVLSNGVWSDWKEISTTPIKKISFPSVATNAGGGGALFSADFGTPITIACTSRGDTQCTPFFYGDGNQWLLLAKDCTTLAPIPAGSYSFDVWYI